MGYIDRQCVHVRWAGGQYTCMQMRQELLTWAFSANVSFNCVPFAVSSSVGRSWVVAPPRQVSCSSSTGGRTGDCLLPRRPTTMNSYKYTSKEHITNLKRLQQCLEIHSNVLKACPFSLHGLLGSGNSVDKYISFRAKTLYRR